MSRGDWGQGSPVQADTCANVLQTKRFEREMVGNDRKRRRPISHPL
jgi:hypothetical protein